MRRITKISIDNYRAYIEPLVLELPAGENLLVYGENGSGKSSLFKALQYFLQSSVYPRVAFETNCFSGRDGGKVEVTYTDIDTNFVETYAVCSNPLLSTNAETFIKTSYRASGFLDYSKLLKVYLNNGKRPNLFKLVLDLLGNYVPVGFDTRPLKDMVGSMMHNIHMSYHRFDNTYQTGLADCRKFEALFPDLIKKLNAQLKPMMANHFGDMGLEIELEEAQAKLNDIARIGDAEIEGQVFVKVTHHGNPLPKYNDRLNEARLSAIATCLYLSSLKLIANTGDTRVLFLDDVFIGLDLGNRLPVLQIVNNEFNDFQRIITTYDKSWYLQAKEVLSDHEDWRFVEMYEGEFVNPVGHQLVKPILVEADSLYSRALHFLNSHDHPDYPAAANYLRKAYEELLQCDVYDKAVRNENYETIAAFRLTNLVASCREFVAQLPEYVVPQDDISQLLTQLRSLLHPLLHPLSHYVPDVPVYKAELKKAMSVYDHLRDEFRHSDYQNHCHVVWEKDLKFELQVKGVSGWDYHYIIRPEQNLYLYDDLSGTKSYSLCRLQVVKLYGTDALGKPYKRFISKESEVGRRMLYTSLRHCYDAILQYLQTSEGITDIVLQPMEDLFFFPDESNVLHPLGYILAQPVANTRRKA